LAAGDADTSDLAFGFVRSQVGGSHPKTHPWIAGARLRVWSLFACFAAGLWCAHRFELALAWPWWASAAAAGLGASLLASTRLWVLPLFAGAWCLGVGWFITAVIDAPQRTLAGMLVPDDAAVVRVRAMILDNPTPSQTPPGALAKFAIHTPGIRFDAAVSGIAFTDQWQSARGKLRVVVSGRRLGPFHAGDLVQIIGRYQPIKPPTNPGETDFAMISSDRGYCGSLHTTSWANVLSEPASASTIQSVESSAIRLLESVRNSARAILIHAAGDDATARGMLLGLILGDFDPSQRDLYDAFTRQSLVHILSISGFHLGVMAALALTLLRLTGDRGWLEPALVAALIAIYACIVPAQSPILRSAAMTLAMLAGEMISRRYDRLTLLGWISILLLVWRPSELWSLGFQLSVGLTAALFWLATPFQASLFPPTLRGTVASQRDIVASRVRNALRGALSVNLLCWTISLPVLMARTGFISPLAIAMGIVLTPVFTLLLWIGYMALLIGVIAPGLESHAASIISVLSHAAATIVRWGDSVPHSTISVPPTPAAWTLIATTVLAVIARFGLSGSFPSRRRWLSVSALGACSLALVIIWSKETTLPSGTILRIDTFDVGSGSCHLLRSGRDSLLWDGGTASVAGPQSVIIQSIRSLGTSNVPVAVITHPDLDHFGALPELVRPLGIRTVLVPQRFLDDAQAHPKGAAKATLSLIRDQGVEVREIHAGDSLTMGEIRLRFISPPRNAAYEKDNAHSLVAVAEKPGDATQLVLMTGDIEDPAINEIRSNYPDLHPIALELPHHGSANTASISWVGEALQPRLVLQSTDAKRMDDARWASVREGRIWLCTASAGATWVEFDRTNAMKFGTYRQR